MFIHGQAVSQRLHPNSIRTSIKPTILSLLTYSISKFQLPFHTSLAAQYNPTKMSCQCPAGCTGCSCSTTKPPTTTPAAPQHFTFTNAKNEHSAFAFIQVTDKNNCEYRIIAYMRDYTPESIPSMQFPPYREMLPTDDKTNNKLFHGPLRGEKANFAASVKLYYCDRLLSEYDITF
jgi:hypothetical protein